jgi:hypothetical protein
MRKKLIAVASLAGLALSCSGTAFAAGYTDDPGQNLGLIDTVVVIYAKNPDGSVNKYDDLPDDAKANVNTDPPFDRHPGEAPALSSSEVDDVVAFLGTLTDGYTPPQP